MELIAPEDSESQRGLTARLARLKCAEFSIYYFLCEECVSTMTSEELRRHEQELSELLRELYAERRKRVRQLNADMLKAKKPERRKVRRGHAKAEALQPETAVRPGNVRFDLHDLPKPVKDLEFLYEDFQSSNKGMVDQWRRRLADLNHDEVAWREELDALAARRGWLPEGLDHTDRKVEE